MHSDGAMYCVRSIALLVSRVVLYLSYIPITVSLMLDFEFSNCEGALILKEWYIVMASCIACDR